MQEDPDLTCSYSISDFERDEVVAVIRDVFRQWQDVSRDEAIKLVFSELQQRGLAARRLGSNIRADLEGHLLAAIRRGIIYREGGVYNLDCASISDYSRDDLLEYIRRAIGRAWHTRAETATATARHLGFRRTGARIKEAIRSAVNSGIRKGKLERDGANRIRKR